MLLGKLKDVKYVKCLAQCLTHGGGSSWRSERGAVVTFGTGRRGCHGHYHTLVWREMPCWRRQPPSSSAPNITPLHPLLWPACTMQGRRQLSPARGKPLWLLGVQLTPDLGSQGVFRPRCIPRQCAVQVNASRWHRPRGTNCFALHMGRASMEETTGDTLCGPGGKNGDKFSCPWKDNSDTADRRLGVRNAAVPKIPLVTSFPVLMWCGCLVVWFGPFPYLVWWFSWSWWGMKGTDRQQSELQRPVSGQWLGVQVWVWRRALLDWRLSHTPR